MRGAGVFRSLLLCLALLAGAAGTLRAQEAPAPAQGELFLEVTLNGEATGLILRFTSGKTGLRSSVQNLRELGLDPALFGVAGQDEFDLDSIAGLHYEYDAARQAIALHIGDALRTPLALQARSTARAMHANVAPGLLLNYDAYEQLGPGARLALQQEVRYFNASGVFSSSGIWNVAHDERQYIRYDTYWLESDPDTLRSWQVGDVITSSLSWSRSIRMGGVQWRKNFDLRPDLLTFPMAALSGSAVVPSALSLYVNGVRQIDTEVPSGPYVINQVSGITGAGQATVITRDAAGRQVSTTVPLYVDTRLLAAGLDDYSVELGALRRGYGANTFGYDRRPAASASLRYGMSDSLTLEAHGEAGNGVVNGGGGALLRLGQAGVINGSLAASDGDGHGAQAGFGYQYISGAYSIDAQSVRATRGYADLATRDGTPVSFVADRLSLSAALAGGQSVGMSYVGYRSPLLAAARIVSLSYSLGLGHGMYFSASAFRDLNQRQTRGVFFNLSVAFGDRVTASANSGNQDGQRSRSLNLSRGPDFGGGLGFGLQSGTLNHVPYTQAQAEYLGNYGQLTLLTQRNAQNRSSAVDLSGAVVAMDGALEPARQVGAAFALVSTDGVAGVPVTQENRVIGRTDGGGHLLVPNLNPYSSNQIGIDTADLPADTRIASTSQTVVPARLAGALAHFVVERYTAATIIVQRPDGQAIAVGTPVRHVESGTSSVVGYDGMTFIDHLADDNHLLIGEEGEQCEVRFAYHYVRGAGLPVIGPLPCTAQAGRH